MNVKEKLARGEFAYGMMLSELYVPNLVRLMGTCGFDFLLVDCEHGYFDMSQVANLIAVAAGEQLPIIVRIAELDRSVITKYLDMGAQGILLANTEGVEMARELVKQCLYAPQGDRGVSTFRAHTGYHNGDTVRIMSEANERNLILCQIESPKAVEDVDKILALPGVTGVMVGPNDLSQHMGIFGKYEDPKMQEAIRKVAQAAIKHHKWAGMISSDAGLLRFSKEAGMTCFSSGSELSMLARGAKEEMQKLRAL